MRPTVTERIMDNPRTLAMSLSFTAARMPFSMFTFAIRSSYTCRIFAAISSKSAIISSKSDRSRQYATVSAMAFMVAVRGTCPSYRAGSELPSTV